MWRADWWPENRACLLAIRLGAWAPCLVTVNPANQSDINSSFVIFWVVVVVWSALHNNIVFMVQLFNLPDYHSFHLSTKFGSWKTGRKKVDFHARAWASFPLVETVRSFSLFQLFRGIFSAAERYRDREREKESNRAELAVGELHSVSRPPYSTGQNDPRIWRFEPWLWKKRRRRRRRKTVFVAFSMAVRFFFHIGLKRKWVVGWLAGVFRDDSFFPSCHSSLCHRAQ